MTEFLVSLVVTAAVAPLVRKLMLRHGILDLPNHRSSHSLPTPRGGGLACGAGILVAAVVAQLSGRPVTWPALAGAIVLAMVGFADDRGGLPPAFRLGTQVLVGLMAGAALGGLWVALVGAALVPAVVNAVNFMDGINGISSLTMAVWGATAVVLSVTEGIPSLGVLGALTAGAALGFLPFNLPHAQLFLGDVGSYLFGALAACGLLLAWVKGASVIVLAAPLAIYAADTATALARRAARGERLTEAHRSHTYQKLAETSGSHTVVALAVAAASGLLAFAWGVLGAIAALAVTLGTLAIYLVGVPAAMAVRRHRAL